MFCRKQHWIFTLSWYICLVNPSLASKELLFIDKQSKLTYAIRYRTLTLDKYSISDGNETFCIDRIQMFSAALILEADKSFGFVIFVIFRSLVDFLTLLINRKTYAVTRKRRVKVQKFSQFILFVMSGGFGLEP